MKRPSFLAVSLAAWAAGACGSTKTTGPAFDVRVHLSSATNTGGCSISWTAVASDPGPLVNYQLGEMPNGSSGSTTWITSGAFRGSGSYSYDHRITMDITLHWIVSTGTWSEDKWLGFTCGAIWQEP